MNYSHTNFISLLVKIKDTKFNFKITDIGRKVNRWVRHLTQLSLHSAQAAKRMQMNKGENKLCFP